MKKTLFIQILLFICFVAYSQDSDIEIYGTVVDVVNGDSYILQTEDGEELKVRLFGIDAPDKDMPYFQVAKRRLHLLIYGKDVTIVVKQTDEKKRHYCLTYLVDGTDVGGDMLANGCAWHDSEIYDNSKYAKYERQAREKRIGLWYDKLPVAPWIVRKINHTGITTKEIYRDKELLKEANRESLE